MASATTTTPALQQISLSLSAEHNAIAPAAQTGPARRQRDLLAIRQSTTLPLDLHSRFSPFNIAVSPDFAAHVQDIHHLLDKAQVDIVERWFSDAAADFPGRMPLEPYEEELLRWIDGPGTRWTPRFGERYGMWRTDYLIERDEGGLEKARICEINARLPYNGFCLVGLHEEASKRLARGSKEFNSPNNFEKTQEAIIDCFDRSKPLYNIRSKWPGLDTRVFAPTYEQRTGHKMQDVEPSELELGPDVHSPTGHRVFYVPKTQHTGEESANSENPLPQQIEQCSIELFQDEIAQMDPQLLRQLATCCVNDFRTIFLTHDKRLLGIIQDELPNLVTRQVLTQEEARRLASSIADTILPGTPSIHEIQRQSREDPTTKDAYIIKPVRDGIGQGIQLGADLSHADWMNLLERLADRRLLPSEGSVVLQCLVNHIWYDIVRHEVDAEAPEKFHLIGSQHMINSRFSAFGPWRIGRELHVGLSAEQKGILMSTVLRPDLPMLEHILDE